MRLRIATWNIRYKSSAADTARVILASQCDVWMLQEVSDFHSLLILLGDDWNGTFVRSQTGTARSHGTAIVARLPLESITSDLLGTFRTPHGTQERHYLQADVAGVTVGCVHLSCTSPLSLVSDRNRRDIYALITRIGRTQTNFVLGGDFNAGRRSPGIRKLRRVLRLAMPKRIHTWRWGLFGRHLDHFFTTSDIRVHAIEKHDRRHSDHHPLVIVIET
jgi:endonuclease/exonuclease/phosphatase family metal-dependent hydrolase